MSVEFSVENLLSELNPKQCEAVQHLGSPLAIIAGAGTGKTRVITYRIAYLIAAKIAKPREILALTFTDKAAAEMEERVDLLVPYGYIDMTISTFHSFGDRMVREFAVDLGLDPDYRLLNQSEQALFLQEHLFELPLRHYRPLSNPTRFVHDLLRHFSRLKDEDISPEEYLAFAERQLTHPNSNLATPQSGKKQLELLFRAVDNSAQDRQAEKQLELAKCYAAYQALMAKNGYMDFGDQIFYCIRLLRQHPDVRRELQQRYQHVLVDEFQDTNYAQFELVKELASGHGNLNVVADDDQSIYKFRGAAISNILNFSETYPRAHYVVLTQNYRSTQSILDSAYRLIRHNNPDRLEVRRNINKNLSGRAPGGKPVEHLHFDTVSAEAEAVAKHIAERVRAGKYRYSDFCVLVRSNHAADPFLHALAEAGIPHQFSGNRGLYQREEIRMLLSFLRTVANPADSQSLYHLALSEIYRMPMADLQQCLSIVTETHRPLLSVMRHRDEYSWQEPLSLEGIATSEKLLADVDKYIEMSRPTPTYSLLYTFLKDSGYLKRLASGESVENETKIRNLAKFFLTVQSYSHFTEGGDLAFFIKHLDLLRDLGDDPGTAETDIDLDAVQVMTIHKAKGLEFPIVFMVGLVNRRFPTDMRRSTIELPEAIIKDKLPQGDFHLQEERRLFYVGMTRAQDELYLTSSRDDGGSRLKKVSIFVAEAIDHAHADEDCIKASAMETLARFDLGADNGVSSDGAIPEDQELRLDPHKIDDYLTCPLKYKYIHILRVPLQPHHTIIYGQAVHEAVREYNHRKKRNAPVTVEDLLEVYRRKWRSAGFISREHEDMRFALGEEVLKRFYERQEAEGRIPALVEEQFTFSVGKNTITGRWDRVDESPDGSVFITDFKSSEVDDEEKAQRRARSSRQLRIYAMAYEARFGKPVTGWRLYFLDSGLIGEAQRREKLLLNTQKDILEAAAGVRQRNFAPTPGPNACPFCPYVDICPAAEGN